jgi:hypothetical protein
MDTNSKEFESWQSFHHFEKEVKENSRYIFSAKTHRFLKTILSTKEKRVYRISKDKLLWRAQIGNDFRQEGNERFEIPFSKERMNPRNNKATEGRINPKGISCLYLASDPEIALSEVRPWIGSKVSAGQFKTERELCVINCTSDSKPSNFYKEEPDPLIRNDIVWGDIDRAFSKPITTTDEHADYVPTQIISELFKNEGFDGIAYRSSLNSFDSNSYNLALFDISAATILNCFLYEVCNMHFEFQEIANPLFFKGDKTFYNQIIGIKKK